MLSTSRPSIALLPVILVITLGFDSPSWKASATAAMIQVVTEDPETIPADDDELDDELDLPLDLDIPLDRPTRPEEMELAPRSDSDSPNATDPEAEDDSSSSATSTPDPEADPKSGTDSLSQEDNVELAATSLDFLFDGKSPSTLEELKAMEEHFASLADQVSPATVNIQIGMAQGSGVVVSDDGYILTAAHVIGRPGGVANVTFPDGRIVEANTLGLARNLDYGMLKIAETEGKRFPHLEIGLSAELQPGQWVMAVGHPGGIDEKRGLVFRAGRIISNHHSRLQTDCTLVGGDSGGPLVDMNGEVIGIHSRIGSKLWDNLHAPIDVYSDNWDKMDRGLVIDGTPYMGFTVRPNSNRITDVKDKGPADKAGLKPMDRIVGIDGTKITSYDELELAIANLLPFQKTTFKIKRRSKTMSLEVIVGESN